MAETIAIGVWDGVEELDFAGPYEVLAAWARYTERDVDVVIVADSAKPVRCAHGLRVVPDRTWGELDEVAVVVMPGGGVNDRLVGGPLVGHLERLAERGALMTSVCTGAFLYAAAGLLDGKPAVHPVRPAAAGLTTVPPSGGATDTRTGGGRRGIAVDQPLVALTAVTATLDVARKVLPRGGSLPADEFERRHRALVLLLWTCALALTAYAAVSGESLWGAASEAVLPLLFALVAGPRAASDRMRATAATLGLSTCAALGVAISGGLIEAHFAFFVLVVLLTLYEDWLLFGLAVAFVLVHHGILGTLEPDSVFRTHQHQNPWGWAAVHALFVAGAGIASVVTWRLNEDVRARMRHVQEELAHAASADALTGLPNRRMLVEDLEAAAATARDGGETAILVLADLDNFKPYNDTFGHQAGDVLLQHLGRRLAEAVEEWGTAYRLGGDEFCVLARGGGDVRQAVEHAATLALSDSGDGFAVSSAVGSAMLPAEATSAEDALRIADQRMYSTKMTGRASADDQTKDVLRRALAERHPSLVHDLDDLADLAARVARLMGLGPGEVDQVRTAAELHDVGKVAIPDAILEKPGDLDENEWAFVKRHTIIGERIISAAPGLARIGAIVRSTHERWDGTGYPDGRAGEEIPLAARIVSVCNAFDAMVNERPYRFSVTLHDALDEIRRGAGTQFDPDVVTAFERAVAALFLNAAA